jgi:ribosomal protein S18 acetylase RimI-like enzyme
MILIRDSVREDIPSTAVFLDNCWKEAYKNILDESCLNSLSSDERAARLYQGFDEQRMDYVVAVEGDSIVGAGAVGESHRDEYPAEGEVYAIYLQQNYYGTGLAGRLYTTLEKKLRDKGFNTFVLSVFRDNIRAVRFYRKQGFDVDAEILMDFGGKSYPVSVMRKRTAY